MEPRVSTPKCRHQDGTKLHTRQPKKYLSQSKISARGQPASDESNYIHILNYLTFFATIFQVKI